MSVLRAFDTRMMRRPASQSLSQDWLSGVGSADVCDSILGVGGSPETTCLDVFEVTNIAPR